MNTNEPIGDIIVLDDFPPEATAMLQALYSRSPKSVREHITKVREVGAEKFMASYYVGYGHKSIGDCGTTTIFIENVSMLAAKSVQDWPLYNGQEASTRYLDMSQRPILNPLETKQGKEIQDRWLKLYETILKELIPHLKERFPKQESEDEKIWLKAINAKAFDIARGFLPAGSTTFLSWHTNLRQAHDHLSDLRYHPLPEIRTIAENITTALQKKYASSFSHKKYADQEAYLEQSASSITYYDRAKAGPYKAQSSLDIKGLKAYKDLLRNRPQKTELPHQLRKFGLLRFSFPLDFGSFRDLQRHRNGVCAMPLLSTKHGFFLWYLEQLPPKLRALAEKEIAALTKKILALKTTPEIRQYYVAMGFTVACEITFALPGSVYVAELRSAQTVHPTLRKVAQQMGESLKKLVPHLALHHDMTEDAWSTKRGKHDIVKKDN